jgi:hypothetical protein
LLIKHDYCRIKMIVDVFKTNIADLERAKWLIHEIETKLPNCKANFDLDDCDRILRVEFKGKLQSDRVIDLLKNVGCIAEVLPDTIEKI